MSEVVGFVPSPGERHGSRNGAKALRILANQAIVGAVFAAHRGPDGDRGVLSGAGLPRGGSARASSPATSRVEVTPD
jgi:hypothetical protein